MAEWRRRRPKRELAAQLLLAVYLRRQRWPRLEMCHFACLCATGVCAASAHSLGLRRADDKCQNIGPKSRQAAVQQQQQQQRFN